MIPLETNRLIIRNFEAGDWQRLQEMVVSYQGTEYAQYDHKWPTTAEEIRKVVQWFASEDDYLAVCLKETDGLIGFIAIERREEEKAHNLGYIFHPDYHGQGYALEGCRKVMQYVFEKLSADRIRTGTHSSNKPSVRLLKKLGLRETAPGEFTISVKEWQAQSQPPG
jgi:[ribosomal protein S5]-alanine N-acetyltransferase